VFTNANDVIEYITTRTRKEYGLSEYKEYMESLNNPQLLLKCIHVAGTNGKGSTTNYLRSIIQNAGYKVGTFTSPHLESHHDRIRINDVSISDEKLVEYANNYVDDWNKFKLSMFEIDMFMSVIYFLEEKVDFVIYEVGLGGTRDATNIIKPLLSVITTIGFDHMQYLGDTLDKIAMEKAGIIKDNIPLVTAEKKEECTKVFEEVCLAKGSRIVFTGDVTNIITGDILTFDYKDYRELKLSTTARYQISNAVTAIEVIHCLIDQGVTVSTKNIYDGLFDGKWKGRYEKISSSPLIYIDGAHNEHGVKALVEIIKDVEKDITIVFAALKDKETDKMLKMLLEVANEVVVTEFDFYRTKKAHDLASNLPVKVIEDWKAAINYAIEQNKGMVLITGSLYFISDVRMYFKEKGIIA